MGKRLSKFAVIVVVLMAFCFMAYNMASAAPFLFGDGGASLQGVLDGITVGPVAGVSSVDVVNDTISDYTDSYWAITGTGGSVSTMIIEIAGYAGTNSFGVYDGANPENRVPLFYGPDSTGAQVTLSITDTGSVYLNHTDTGVDFCGNHFGFYLKVPNIGAIWFSDTSLNSDQVDHMVAYQGKNIDTVQILPWAAGLWTNNEYVLAFEDLCGGGDLDYDDMVVMIESVTPSPEPGTLLLLGMGLMGISFVVKKKNPFQRA